MDPKLYNALNMQAQRNTLKALNMQRKINSSLPQRESGLGKISKMGSTMRSDNSNYQPNASYGQIAVGKVSFLQTCANS